MIGIFRFMNTDTAVNRPPAVDFVVASLLLNRCCRLRSPDEIWTTTSRSLFVGFEPYRSEAEIPFRDPRSGMQKVPERSLGTFIFTDGNSQCCMFFTSHLPNQLTNIMSVPLKI